MTEDETEAEVQLLELVRGNDAEEFKLTIEREAGAWNVTLSTPPHDARHKRHGVGSEVPMREGKSHKFKWQRKSHRQG
jgi:hypothetical protein